MKTINIGQREYALNTDLEKGHVLVNLSLEERIDLICYYMLITNGDVQDEDFSQWRFFLGAGLNYADDPIYGLSRDGTANGYKPNGTGLLSLPFEQHVRWQCIWSFLGEHNELLNYGLKTNEAEMLRAYKAGEIKALRTDLFSQYFSKGTIVKEWALNELIPHWSPHFAKYFSEQNKKPIMKAKEELRNWMRESPLSSQPKLIYALKDAILDISVTHPHLIDEESFLELATGAKKGYNILFDKKCNNKELDTRKDLDKIIEYSEYPYALCRGHYSKLESVLCYFFKFVNAKAFGLKRKLPAQ